jgi:hypothetical protein
MRFVITVMVRDEVDIIAAWVEHHAAQGADLIIATDNGSVDGTTEVLKAYADLGIVELQHDPVHRKQQHVVVTNMARRAQTEYAADWVINADADEFWVPQDKSLTLRSALAAIPLSLNAFTVPVVNLIGPPARRGSGLDRLLWRDYRTNEQLREVGVYAQPTANAVHRGAADIVVAQGNHFVSLPSNGQPDPLSSSKCCIFRGAPASNCSARSSRPVRRTNKTLTCGRARTTTVRPTTGGTSPVGCCPPSCFANRLRKSCSRVSAKDSSPATSGCTTISRPFATRPCAPTYSTPCSTVRTTS